MAAAHAPWKLRQGCVRFRGGLKWSSKGIGGPFSIEPKAVGSNGHRPPTLRLRFLS